MSYEYITKYTSNQDNWKKGRQGNKVEGITIHHWGSSHSLDYLGIVTFLCSYRPTNPTSAHYVAQGVDQNGKSARKVACIVDPEDTAYHAGNWQANLTEIGIECRPYPTDADYDVIAELVARLWVTYGKLPLYPHRHWTSTECPGHYDVARIQKEAEAKYPALKAGTTPPTTTTPTPTSTPEEDDPLAGYTLDQIAEAVLTGKPADRIPAPKANVAADPKNPTWTTSSYLYYTYASLMDARGQITALTTQVAALAAAVKALADSQGVSGDDLVAAVKEAANEALSGLSVTLTAQSAAADTTTDGSAA